jgi:hypothetical protein
VSDAAALLASWRKARAATAGFSLTDGWSGASVAAVRGGEFCAPVGFVDTAAALRVALCWPAGPF